MANERDSPELERDSDPMDEDNVVGLEDDEDFEESEDAEDEETEDDI
jgi:hypothetical protein